VSAHPHHDPAAAGPPLELTHAQMNAAYASGQAAPFALAIGWLARYRDAWWVVYEGGWLRITDTATTRDLDERAAQMTEADTQAARQAAIRGALATSGGVADNAAAGSSDSA
jgi:hypothetical protein